MQRYFDYVCRNFAKERIMAHFIENPSLIDDLIDRLQEEPVAWEDDEFTPPSTPVSEDAE